jgi:hypothetical protein
VERHRARRSPKRSRLAKGIRLTKAAKPRSPFELNKPDYLRWGALRSSSASSSTPAGCLLQLAHGLDEGARGAKSGCKSNKHCFFSILATLSPDSFRSS